MANHDGHHDKTTTSDTTTPTRDDRILVSIPDACRLLGVGRSTVYELLGSGSLDGVKLRKRRLVVRSSISRFVASIGGPAE